MKAKWAVLTLATLCSGCATGSNSTLSSYLPAWTNPFPSVAAAKPKPATPPSDDISLDKKPAPKADFYLAAGKLADSRGDQKTAVAQYQKAIDLDPKDITAYLYLGQLYERTHQLEQAESAYAKAIKAAPNDATPLNHMALCLERQGRRDESINYFQQAIKLQQHQPYYRNNIARVLVKSGRAKEAFEHLQTVHSVPEAHYNMGVLLSQSGQPDAAKQHFAAALQVDPGFVAAQDALSQLNETSSQAAMLQGSAQTAQPQSRPTAKQVSAPRNLRAQVQPRSQPQEVEIEIEEEPVEEAPPARDSYYDGAEETESVPTEVLASRPQQQKSKRKSVSELRAKIEDSTAN